jgi:hypothetical protein
MRIFFGILIDFGNVIPANFPEEFSGGFGVEAGIRRFQNKEETII